VFDQQSFEKKAKELFYNHHRYPTQHSHDAYVAHTTEGYMVGFIIHEAYVTSLSWARRRLQNKPVFARVS
jgi:hypothetical protein